MTDRNSLIVRGARVHNLQNVDVELPRDSLIVVTGLSATACFASIRMRAFSTQLLAAAHVNALYPACARTHGT